VILQYGIAYRVFDENLDLVIDLDQYSHVVKQRQNFRLFVLDVLLGNNCMTLGGGLADRCSKGS
jgi:hypothetical protein